MISVTVLFLTASLLQPLPPSKYIQGLENTELRETCTAFTSQTLLYLLVQAKQGVPVEVELATVGAAAKKAGIPSETLLLLVSAVFDPAVKNLAPAFEAEVRSCVSYHLKKGAVKT